MSIIKLSGPTLSIRDWTEQDLPLYWKWNIGHHRWMDFNGPYYPKQTPEQVENTIMVYKRKIAERSWRVPRKRLAIAANGNDRLLGTVSWYWQSQPTNWRSIGIVIYDDQDWGKGIGFEALSLWIQYLFDQDPSLVRLDLRTWSGNGGMVRLGLKLGFKQEACFRKARIVKGQYYDSIGMGILREEWSTSY
ncbi:MAG: GNAT family protein [Bacteroidota bacterium]